MRMHLSVVVICMFTLSTFGQKTSSKYEPGTITSVTAHVNTPGEAVGDVARYDVSVKIRNVVYMVLYTPQPGSNTVEYSPGIEMLFLVGDNTLTFNSKTSGVTAVEVPILRREVLPVQGGIDWSKAPGQYFNIKQQHLSEALALTQDQQEKIKPLIEQESGEAGMILWTPVVSPKDRLKQYEKIVTASDEKIKAFLSPSQVATLAELRKQQKVELKNLIAKQKSSE